MATPPGGIGVQQIGRRSIARFDEATAASSSIAVFQNHYRQQADQMTYLKQSTASQAISLGPFVDSTDGDTTETGLTIANTDILLSKSGGASAAKNSGGATHDSGGIYTATLDATDTDTVGTLDVTVHVSGALYVKRSFQVLEEAIYDALIGASATGFNSSGQIALLTATQASIDAIETDTSTTLQGELDAIQAAVITNAAGTDIAADIIAVKAETASILTDTAEIGAAGAGLSDLGGMSTGMKAEVNAECDTAITDAALATAANLATVDTVVDAVKAVTDVLPDSGALTSLATASALSIVDGIVDTILLDTAELQTNQGNWATATGFSTHTAANVRAEIDSNSTQLAAIVADTQDIQTQVGTAGAGLTGLGGMSTTMKAQVNTEADTALSDYDPPTRAELTTDTSSVLTRLGTPAGADIAADIATVDSNVDAILVDTGTTIPATIATVDSNVDAILVDTVTLGTPAGASHAADIAAIKVDTAATLVDTGTTLPASLATIDSNVDAILVDTGTTLPATLAALNDISVSDVLTTAMTEAYGTDGSTFTVAQALYEICQGVTEFAIAGTTKTVKKRDGSTTAATYTLDSATTPTSITRAT